MNGLFDNDQAPPAPKQRPRPPLMLRDEILSIQQAARIVNRSEKTIREWNDEHGIGQQSGPGAPIEISWIALLMVAAGDFETLEKFRNDDRRSWQVVRYFRVFGFSGADIRKKRESLERSATGHLTKEAQGLLIEHEALDLPRQTLPTASSRLAGNPMRSFQPSDWNDEMEAAMIDDQIVQVALRGGGVLDSFRSALFLAARKEGVPVNEYVLRSAGERLARDGYRFNGVFEIDDLNEGAI
jgi:hypothetical protein